MPTAGRTPSARAQWRGRFLIALAALLWGTGGAWAKCPPLAALEPAQRGLLLGCWRAGFAALFLAGLLRHPMPKFRPVVVLMVAAFATMNVCVMLAMSFTTAAASIVLQYTSVFWVTALARILGERADRRDWVCTAAALSGVVVLLGGEWGRGTEQGALLALASGLTYAVVVLCLRTLRDTDAAWLVWSNHFGAWVLLVAFAWRPSATLDAVQWSVLAGMGACQMGLPYWLFARGLHVVPATEAALWCLLEPVSTPLWTWVFWGERIPRATLVGGAIVLAALIARLRRRAPQVAESATAAAR
ncbi:MAG: hypothetical protein D6725_14105 [Planctomycetota bacterium]|nr:MAG: hypothetical protein D6725_14105 [Planctomycetota bacterium]